MRQRSGRRSWSLFEQESSPGSCGRPVETHENELQLQFMPDPDPLSIVTFHLHAPCCAAWELERWG